MLTTIVGHQYGWSAVSGEPMTWRQFFYARQVAGEFVVGGPRREAEAIEDAREREARKNARRSSRPGF